MKPERIYVSLFIRSCGYFLTLFFLFGIIASLINFINFKDEADKIGFILFFFCLGSPFVILTWLVHESYLFEEDTISKKIPFLKEKIISINQITGWAVMSAQYINEFIIYYINQDQKHKKTKIALSGKKIKSGASHFMNHHYEELKKRNINKIKTEGLIFKIRRNKKIKVNRDTIEIIYDDHNSEIYQWDNIKDIIMKGNGLTIFFRIEINDQLVLKFTNYQCEGGVGLVEFLAEEIKPLINKSKFKKIEQTASQ